MWNPFLAGTMGANGLAAKDQSKECYAEEVRVTKRVTDSTAGSGRGTMISFEDCFALCGLTRDEVLALAEHEHIPEIAAVALGQYLLNQPTGRTTIRAMIARNIHSARSRGDMRHAEELAVTLQHFVTSHPEVLAH